MALFTRLTEILPHIEFDCTVNGKELTAAVTHVDYSGRLPFYHVFFSDGHRDAYVPGDEEVHEGFGRTRHMDAYEAAVYDDLCVVPLLKKGTGRFCIRVHQPGEESFTIWVRERKGFYSVYYKGQYQFTLKKWEQWAVSTMRGKGYVINQQLARLVTKHLDGNPV